MGNKKDNTIINLKITKEKQSIKPFKKQNIQLEQQTQDKNKQDQQQKQQTQESVQEGRKAGIPRNVNTYSHFLNQEYITEQDIEWVLQLRNQDDSLKQKLSRIPNQPFSVYDKKIKSMEKSHSTKDVEIKGNFLFLEHLVRRRIGPTPNLSIVQFESGLRELRGKDQRIAQLEKGWCSIPKKDKKEFPKFLPKLKKNQKQEKILKKQERWKIYFMMDLIDILVYQNLQKHLEKKMLHHICIYVAQLHSLLQQIGKHLQGEDKMDIFIFYEDFYIQLLIFLSLVNNKFTKNTKINYYSSK